eukprot:scaffold523_cov166-Amphora_coffeaeformis.AAC.6
MVGGACPHILVLSVFQFRWDGVRCIERIVDWIGNSSNTRRNSRTGMQTTSDTRLLTRLPFSRFAEAAAPQSIETAKRKTLFDIDTRPISFMKYLFLICLALLTLGVLAQTTTHAKKKGEDEERRLDYYGVRRSYSYGGSSYYYGSGGYYGGGRGYYGPGFYPGYYPYYWRPYYFPYYYPYYPYPPTPSPPPTNCPCGSSCFLPHGGGLGTCQSDGSTCAVNIQPPNCNPPQMSLTASECQELGGSIVGDPGDGRTSRPDYRCESNDEPILGIVVGTGAIEGAVCCETAPTPTPPPPSTSITYEQCNASGGRPTLDPAQCDYDGKPILGIIVDSVPFGGYACC